MLKRIINFIVFFVLCFICYADISNDDMANSEAEWYDAKTVMLHIPGIETFFISLMPIGSGFNTEFSQGEAVKEFKQIIDTLEHFGIQVYLTNEIFLENVTDSTGQTIMGPKLYELQNFAKSFLSFDLSQLQYPLSLNLTVYKTHTIASMTPKNLVNLIFLNPAIQLNNEENHLESNSNVKSKFIVNPIVNFFYINDLAINTKNGIIQGNLTNPRRKDEPKIFAYLLKNLHIEPYYKLKDEAKLEGGDFIPADNICFIGQGIRTNEKAIIQLLENMVFGTEKVVVVKDNLKIPYQMYLVKYFNFLNKNTVVLGENRIDGKDALKADVYKLDFRRNKYIIEKRDINFASYLKNHLNYNIIPVSVDDQQHFATEFFLVKENLIIGSEGVSNDYKQALKEAGITAIWLNVKNINAGYGSINSVIQVLKRKKTQSKNKFKDNTNNNEDSANNSQSYISL